MPLELVFNHGSNVETRWEAMREGSYVTPKDRFYVRNHARPRRSTASWTLRIEGPGISRGLTLDYENLLALLASRACTFLPWPSLDPRGHGC